MARSFLRSRTVFASCLLALPAVALVGACSSTSTAPPANTKTNFGDGGTTDATKPKDAAKDVSKIDGRASDAAEDAALGEGGAVGVPCKAGSECHTGVCEPTVDQGMQFDGPVHFDAGLCETEGKCVCAASTCTDGVKNGKETGIDCGGGACPPCAVGSPCLTGMDCGQKECGFGFKGAACSGVTPDGGTRDAGACICEAPTCNDGVQNQDETDVDCGGSTCAKCPTGKSCKVMSDCTNNICAAPTGSTALICACPAGMTEAPTSNSVPYCIDTWEVSYTQYSAFIGSANATTLAQQPAECKFNTTFVPSDKWPQVSFAANNPVAYVNWCDAFAYCSAVGKHLCGAIANPTTHAAGGASIPFPSATGDAGAQAANDHSQDEWFNACSSQGQNTWPFGNTYGSGYCNGADSPAQAKSGPVDVPPGMIGFTVDTPAASCVLDTSCAGSDQAGVLSTVAANQTVTCETLAPTMGAMPACSPAFIESTCVGGSSTNVVFDLAGNVAEWENSCSGTTDGNDLCLLRGGSYDSPNPSASLACATNATAQPPQKRSMVGADIGFRCCL